jgi:F-type H+-transporting ATPase subunit epsilon
MVRDDTFRCTVVTPERPVLDVAATFAALPAHDGEIGILHNRAPLLAKLGIGVLRVETPAEKHLLYVDGGFAPVGHNRLTILTEQAKKADEIDAKAASQKLAEAKAMPAHTVEEVEQRSREIKRANVQLQLAKS